MVSARQKIRNMGSLYVSRLINFAETFNAKVTKSNQFNSGGGSCMEMTLPVT